MSSMFDSSFDQSSENVLPLLQKVYSLDAIAREPWSADSVLYLPLGRQMLIDNGGAEALASLLYLNVLNAEHRLSFVKNVAEMSPSGRGPLLHCGKYTVGEFEPIVNFCNLKGIKLLGDYFESTKKSYVKSYLLLIQKCFSDVLSHFIWRDAANLKVVQGIYDELYPWPLGKIVYLKEYYFMKNKMEATKLWTATRSDLLARFSEIAESLNRKLDGKLYLIENKLSEADILLYSYMKALSSQHLDFKDLREAVDKFRNLADFYANLDSKYDSVVKEAVPSGLFA